MQLLIKIKKNLAFMAEFIKKGILNIKD